MVLYQPRWQRGWYFVHEYVSREIEEDETGLGSLAEMAVMDYLFLVEEDFSEIPGPDREILWSAILKFARTWDGKDWDKVEEFKLQVLRCWWGDYSLRCQGAKNFRQGIKEVFGWDCDTKDDPDVPYEPIGNAEYVWVENTP